MAVGELGPVRRIVTGHDSDGRPILQSDRCFATNPIPSGAAEFVDLWTAPSLPVDNDDQSDCCLAGSQAHEPASVIRIVDLLPGRSSDLHRTDTMDCCVLLSGELELELEGGTTTRVQPGDVVVQRGTMHLWRNPSTTSPCRILFVLTKAKPHVHEGRPLPEVHG